MNFQRFFSHIVFVFQSDPSKKITITRWELIEQALLRDIHSTYELQDAILSYNTRYAKQWKFKSLHAMFEVSSIVHPKR